MNIVLYTEDLQLSSYLKKSGIISSCTEFQIVYETSDLLEVKSYFESFRSVNAVIVCVKHPGVREKEIIEEFNKMRVITNLIFYSENADLSIAFETIRNGAFDYQIKPYNKENVLAMIERLQIQIDKRDGFKKNQFITNNEYMILKSDLINGRNDFYEMLNNLFYRAESNRMMKNYDIQMAFYHMYEQLMHDMEIEFPYFPVYFNHGDLAVLLASNSREAEELKEAVEMVGVNLFDCIQGFKVEGYSMVIQRVMKYAWENVEHNITLEKIANELYINKSYLSHLFKRETGRTFINFHTEIRMKRSRILLRNKYKVYECALQLGYDDTEYFSKVFKNYYGYKPTEYMSKYYNKAFHHTNQVVCQ